MPASANGVVGLKPTYGRVSRFGVLPMAPSLDHVGPITRRVADAAIMFDAIAGFDPQDPTSLNEPPSNVLGQTGLGVRDIRIGLDRAYALKGIDSGQAAAIEEALKVMAGLGAHIVDVKMPDLTGVVEEWMTICSSEMVAAHAANYPSRAREYGPYLREFLESGSRVTALQLSAARKRRAELTAQLVALLDSVDAMADRRVAIQRGPSLTSCRSDRCRPTMPPGLPRRLVAQSSRCRWTSPGCRQSACLVDSRRRVFRTVSSSRAVG